MKSETISVGVIGCGHWGPNHVRVFSQLKECKVVAIADVSEQRRAAVRENYPHLATFSDYRDLLQDTKIDAVVVSTPTQTHNGIVGEALDAGKHVLCEKPLCIRSADGERLVELAKRKGLTLMVGHVFLFNPG